MNKSMMLLVVAVVACSLWVVELRHRNRLLFVELQKATQERDRLNIEWGQMLLEQGAWSEQRRVEETARVRLGLSQPAPEQIVVVRDTGAGARP